MNALILAAGYATRLYPLTLNKAKPLLPVGGKRIIEWLVDHLIEIDELKIDSKRQRVEVVCRLNGEVSPIGITIERYRLSESAGKNFIEVLDSSATRPWLQTVMRDHLHGRKFEVPSWAATAL